MRGKLARFRVTFSGRLILIKPPFCDSHERQTALSVRFRSIGCHSSDWRRGSRWRYHALLEAAVRELVLHYTNSSRLRALVRILSGLGRVIAGPPDPDVLRYGGQRKPDGPSSEDPLPASAHLVTYSMFVGDVDAGHGATPLPQAARAAGGKTVDGFQMVEGGIEIMPDFLLGG